MRIAVIGDKEDTRQLVEALIQHDCKLRGSDNDELCELVEADDDEEAIIFDGNGMPAPGKTAIVNKGNIQVVCGLMMVEVQRLMRNIFAEAREVFMPTKNHNFYPREPLYRNHNRIQHRDLQRNNKLSRAEYKRRGSKFNCKNSRLKKK